MDILLEVFGQLDGRALLFLGLCVVAWLVMILFGFLTERSLGRIACLLAIATAPISIVLICYDARVRTELKDAGGKITSLASAQRVLAARLDVQSQQPGLEDRAHAVTERYIDELRELAQGTEMLPDENAYFAALIDELNRCVPGDRVVDVVQPFNCDRPSANQALRNYMKVVDAATARGVQYELYLRPAHGTDAARLNVAVTNFTTIGVTVHIVENFGSERSAANFCSFERRSGARTACAPQRRDDAWIMRGWRTVDRNRFEQYDQSLRDISQRIEHTYPGANRAEAAPGGASAR